MPAQQNDFATKRFEETKAKAEQGDAEAEWLLSCQYSLGIGTEKNQDEGLRWCRKAATQGCTAAEECLGSYYVEGKSVPQDYNEAFKWFKIAAEKGDINAITWLS